MLQTDPVGHFHHPLSLCLGVVVLPTIPEAYGIETEMKLYPGLRHEILNEDDYQHIYDDILEWTTNKLKGDFI